MKYLVALVFCLLAPFSAAQIDQPKEITTHQTFGDYRVHFTVFNSTSIPANVAQSYGLVRGSNRALVNVSLVKITDGVPSLGLKAEVTGSAKNLMQQSQTLKFLTIDEGDAVYYLAPFVFNNEEVLHFTVNVQAPDQAAPFQVTFNRTLYKD